MKHCWEAVPNYSCDQKKVFDRENRLIPRKIKETIHSLRNPNHFNEISYMLSLVVTYLFHTVDSGSLKFYSLISLICRIARLPI